MLEAYAAHLLDLAPVAGRRLKVVVDAGNGMAGHTVPAVWSARDVVDLVPLYFELDGTFPNHDANPLDRATLLDLQAGCWRDGADVGLAFDGDADRCFLVDEPGAVVSPSRCTALIAVRELARSRAHDHPQPDHEPGCARDRPRARRHPGPDEGRALRHQGAMAETGRHLRRRALRPLLLPRLLVRRLRHARGSALAGGARRSDRPLSALVGVRPLCRLRRDQQRGCRRPAVLGRIRSLRRPRGVKLDDLDGLTVTHAEWWFNVRASNTEPLLRLNAEGIDRPPWNASATSCSG